MAGELSFKHSVEGVQQTLSRLMEVKQGIRGKVLRKAGNEASKVALRALKAAAPAKTEWGTGHWKKSLGRKVKVYGSKMVYLAGPRSKYVGFGKLKHRYWRDANGKVRKAPVDRFKEPNERFQKRRPVFYSHLIHKRHDTFGKAARAARAQEEAAINRVLDEWAGSIGGGA